MGDTEQELESFRNEWRHEVSQAKVKRRLSAADIAPVIASGSTRHEKGYPVPLTLNSSRAEVKQLHDDYEPPAYQGLDDFDDPHQTKDRHHRRGNVYRQPQSALDHYEHAVERETAGNLGDSVSLYRRAFKLNSEVDREYKKKHFPPSSSSSKQNAAREIKKSAEDIADQDLEKPAPCLPIEDLLEQFSELAIAPAPPETELSPPPPCPIAYVPEEILGAIFEALADVDGALLARLSQVCKRFAYLVSFEDRLWKRIAFSSSYGFNTMHYRYNCNVDWSSLHGFSTAAAGRTSLLYRSLDLTPSAYPTYRTQFRHRPRIRFNGCYIATSNYPRPGASHQSQYSWSSPIHIVTYHRYLRFFRDGSVISLLTVSEPSAVVHHMTRDNMNANHSDNLQASVMNGALKGRWRLTGSISQHNDTKIESDQEEGANADEDEGTLHIETQGVTPKYMWFLQLAFGSAGRKDGTRNNKLSWKSYWHYNKMTDDWGEFGLKHDKPFYFSRVKSYGFGL